MTGVESRVYFNYFVNITRKFITSLGFFHQFLLEETNLSFKSITHFGAPKVVFPPLQSSLGKKAIHTIYACVSVCTRAHTHSLLAV